LKGALIWKGALIGRRALNRIITVNVSSTKTEIFAKVVKDTQQQTPHKKLCLAIVAIVWCGKFVALFGSTKVHVSTRNQLVLFPIQIITILAYSVARISESIPLDFHRSQSVVLDSFTALRVRRRVLYFVVFVSATLVPSFVFLGIAKVGLAYSWFPCDVVIFQN